MSVTRREIPDDPRSWRIGLVGYGEVGRILAEDLTAAGGGRIIAYDRKFATSEGSELEAHAEALGVGRAADHQELAAVSDLIISAVTASQAVSVAAACAPGIRAGGWFLDLNSASPGAKIEGAGLITAAGGRFVEGAVMTSVPPYRLKVPMLLGGPDGAALAPGLTRLGFAARHGDDRLGVASATKMCRSVLIKGLEAMVIESFTAARAYGVEDAVLASLAETFPAIDWEQTGRYFFERVIQHGRRRAEEMREVAQTVTEIGLDPLSAGGTAKRQDWVADLAACGLFGDRQAAGFGKTADWRREADLILGSLRPGGEAR